MIILHLNENQNYKYDNSYIVVNIHYHNQFKHTSVTETSVNVTDIHYSLKLQNYLSSLFYFYFSLKLSNSLTFLEIQKNTIFYEYLESKGLAIY